MFPHAKQQPTASTPVEIGTGKFSMVGMAYVKFYKLAGETRYLEAAPASLKRWVAT